LRKKPSKHPRNKQQSDRELFTAERVLAVELQTESKEPTMLKPCILAALAVVLFSPVIKADVNDPVNAAVTAGNLFAADLFGQLRHADGNLCISPYSISSALQMTAAGAAGETESQMLATLHWTGPGQDLPAASAALTGQLITPVNEHLPSPSQTAPRISIANALFGQSGYPYRQAFLDVLSRQYAAPLQNVDFAAHPQQAGDHINRWASEKTHGKIANAIPSSAITPATRLVLVDAVYFKDAWETPFPKSATLNQNFYVSGEEPRAVPIMQQSDSFDYMENDALQAVELPYVGDFSLVILLPRQRDGLAAMEKSISADALSSWLKGLTLQSVHIFLPKFKIEGEYELSATLAKLGMPDAFKPQKADFSNMTSADKFCIDQVIHKTYIDLDETGTEAAAVTAVTMRMSAVFGGSSTKPVLFRADHPFVFVLRHRNTGAILFMGRVADPK
jgi:serpin B